jgi:hypothetical protein
MIYQEPLFAAIHGALRLYAERACFPHTAAAGVYPSVTLERPYCAVR